MPLYCPAESELRDFVEKVMREHHAPLADAEVRLEPKDRGQGLGDALLIIDAYRWPEFEPAEQNAVIDHELTHLELVLNGDIVRRDDYNRPKLRIRLHDHQFGWFDGVARRHPISSQETQQAKRFVDEFGQIYLPFTQDEVVPLKPRKAAHKR